MIQVKNCNALMVDNATGQPTSGFIGRPTDEFEVRVQFFGDDPDGGCNYSWSAEPSYAVEWLDNQFGFKRKFRVRANGRIHCKLTDSNGFTHDVPSLGVRSSG